MSERLIVALDVASLDEAIAWLDRLPDVTFWKVGLELFISAGPAIIEAIKGRNKQIFLDLKLHDIPHTIEGAARSAARWGVDLLTVHAAGGRSALVAAQDGALAGAAAAGVAPPKIVAVTLLTSLGIAQLRDELKVGSTPEGYALHLAELARSSGLAGAVCSPLEAARLRSRLRKTLDGQEFLLVCPGVRPTWAAANDQQRTLTPSEAITAGASYLVVGRPITAAPNPITAWTKISQEIASPLI